MTVVRDLSSKPPGFACSVLKFHKKKVKPFSVVEKLGPELCAVFFSIQRSNFPCNRPPGAQRCRNVNGTSRVGVCWCATDELKECFSKQKDSIVSAMYTILVPVRCGRSWEGMLKYSAGCNC